MSSRKWPPVSARKPMQMYLLGAVTKEPLYDHATHITIRWEFPFSLHRKTESSNLNIINIFYLSFETQYLI
jgi:hypothetical protein